jgi:hypothetical protein
VKPILIVSAVPRNCRAALSIAVGSYLLAMYPAYAQGASGNAFNPDISVILDGKYAHYSQDPSRYGIDGFLLSNDNGLPPSGLSLGESEFSLSANVDDQFFGQLTAALASEGDTTEISVEEAFVQTTALPAGLAIKAGRYFSNIGYLNSKHGHVWDFVDQPLVYKAFLGNQYGDDGVQLRWVAPLDLLVEMGGEAFRGAQFPAAGATHGGIGSWTAFTHVGGDIGDEQSWRTGVSYLSAGSLDRESVMPNGDVLTFTGSDRVWIADFIWKWADHGNPRTRNLVIQAEYLYRQEEGKVVNTTIDYANAVLPPDFVAPDHNYHGTQSGFYIQSVYQFIPRWRVGLRYDQLTADNHGPSLGVDTPLNQTAHSPSRVTAMMDFSNSEFSRFRLQVARDQSQEQPDTQLMLQYIMSIGAHGAHQF